jgi:hypothetical protein
MEELVSVLCITLCLVLAWIFWASFQQSVAVREHAKLNCSMVAQYNKQASRADALMTKQEETDIRVRELLDRQDALLTRAESLLTRLEAMPRDRLDLK